MLRRLQSLSPCWQTWDHHQRIKPLPHDSRPHLRFTTRPLLMFPLHQHLHKSLLSTLLLLTTLPRLCLALEAVAPPPSPCPSPPLRPTTISSSVENALPKSLAPISLHSTRTGILITSSVPAAARAWTAISSTPRRESSALIAPVSNYAARNATNPSLAHISSTLMVVQSTTSAFQSPPADAATTLFLLAMLTLRPSTSSGIQNASPVRAV